MVSKPTSKSGNSGKPKAKKLNYDDDINPVEFANELAAAEDKKKEVNTVTNEVNKEEVKDTKVEQATELAKKTQDLMAQGMSMEEAMAEVMKGLKIKTVGGRTILDSAGLIERMEAETSIGELKRRIKIAYAKRSKSMGKPSEAKYEEEIAAGQRRLNELIAQCEAIEDPVARIRKYEELGETPGAILQMILKLLEEGSKDIIAAIKESDKALTLKGQKMAIQEQDGTYSGGVEDKIGQFGQVYLELFNDRVGKGDTRCIALNKAHNYIESVRK